VGVHFGDIEGITASLWSNAWARRGRERLAFAPRNDDAPTLMRHPGGRKAGARCGCKGLPGNGKNAAGPFGAGCGADLGQGAADEWDDGGCRLLVCAHSSWAITRGRHSQATWDHTISGRLLAVALWSRTRRDRPQRWYCGRYGWGNPGCKRPSRLREPRSSSRRPTAAVREGFGRSWEMLHPRPNRESDRENCSGSRCQRDDIKPGSRNRSACGFEWRAREDGGLRRAPHRYEKGRRVYDDARPLDHYGQRIVRRVMIRWPEWALRPTSSLIAGSWELAGDSGCHNSPMEVVVPDDQYTCMLERERPFSKSGSRVRRNAADVGQELTKKDPAASSMGCCES